MITFLVCIAALVAGFFIYGRFVDRFFGSDPSRKTPAETMADGVDYIKLPTWKVFIIQFLNIAGLGPIFGAILGAAYGPMAYLWIVAGCIFMGAVHDYFSGMLSLRNGGVNMPDLVGMYLGPKVKNVLVILVCFLMLAVGVSFVTGPADLMQSLTGWDKTWWLYIIFFYYILATLLPIDKIIGSVYPLFGAALLFMAVGVFGAMIVGDIKGTVEMQEMTLSTFRNFHSDPQNNVLVPMLFVVISCGAISGFHATQSPLMSRCLKNEKYVRPVFYGAMIAEGIVAMIWAAAAIAYFGGPEGLNQAATEGIMINGTLTKVTPAIAVDMICRSWLGQFGAVIAIIGVVVCPITSGDTAFRSLRLTVADLARYDQKSILRRLVISVPAFAVAYFCCMVDFSTLWQYVGICNQLLAAFVLWMATAYLISVKKPHWMTSLPATFITFICVSYFFIAPYKAGGLHLAPVAGYCAGAAVALGLLIYFIARGRKTAAELG
ncbi:MAG: carbon starvation protein A [Bacteroidetes bacterium]|uniref:Carbon starvation protein A n=1 Tax=Candidatus Cryptobacteroides intestinavium TaxID=2840766 RepID=A0A9D9F0X9_9BACT|nr:carbon starvation protein A [Candidatus Cryptobacteroides intestinavium]